MRIAREAREAHDVAQPPLRAWTMREEQTLREMWNAGIGAAAIAVTLGRSTYAVCKKAKNLRLRRHGAKINKPMTQVELDQMVKLFQQGTSLRGIASILDRSQTSISTWLDKLGVRAIQPHSKKDELDLPTSAPEPPITTVSVGPLYRPGDQVMVYGPVLDKRSLDQTLIDWQPVTVISDTGRFVRVDHGAYTRCYHYDEVRKA